MTTHAERLYQLAARAYPPSYRAEHGDELIATACELRDSRVCLREALGLIKGGMRTRSRASTTGSGAGVWISGLRLGLLLFAVSQLAWTLAPPMEWGFIGHGPGWGYALSIATVAGLTMTTGRWYAAFWTVSSIGVWVWSLANKPDQVPWTALVTWSALLFELALLTIVWWLALKTDGRRAISPVAAVPVTAAYWLAFTIAPGFLAGNMFERTGTMFVVAALALVAVAIITIDPRLMAGTAVFLALAAASSLTFSLPATELVYFTPELSIVAIALAAAGFAVRRGSRHLRRI